MLADGEANRKRKLEEKEKNAREGVKFPSEN